MASLITADSAILGGKPIIRGRGGYCGRKADGNTPAMAAER